MPPPDGLSGGAELERILASIAAQTAATVTVSVGFLEGATYPDGTPVAYIAAIQEWGGTFPIPARTQSVFRKVLKNGTFARNGRFVKRKAANFESSHAVGEHSITIPPRPFFRRMIAEKQAEWGPATAAALKAENYDPVAALDLVGAAIAGQLKQSIVDLTEPALAASTIRRKGFAKPLVDTGTMLNAVDHEVTT